MYAQLFVQSPLLVLPIGALLLFAAVFLVMIVRVFGRSQATYDAIARLPLEGGIGAQDGAERARHV